MSSNGIFKSKRETYIDNCYFDMGVAADLAKMNSAVSKATAVKIADFNVMKHQLLITNTLTDGSGDPVDIVVYFKHPDNPEPTTDSGGTLIETLLVDGGENFNFSVDGSPYIQFEAGTEIWVAKYDNGGGVPTITGGKLKIVTA